MIVTGENFKNKVVPKGVGGLLGRTRGVRRGVRGVRTRLRTGRVRSSINKKTIAMGIGNGGRLVSVGVGPRMISPSSVRVLRSLILDTIGRTLEDISRVRTDRVDGMAKKVGVPKLF